MRSEILKLAFTQYGIREIPGPQENNPEILKYFKEIGHDWVQDDEKAWCSAFTNWICKSVGYAWSGELNARSWLATGFATTTPVPGDIVVLWRESITSWKGHVGFYINHDDSNIWVLGGNQNNSVNIAPYPIGRLLEYRRV
jgi:uncharacterized protein (TIGR02594 family)